MIMRSVLLASVFAIAASIACAQEASPPIAHIPGVDAAMQGASGAVPGWQAVCGFKWRQYRAATGASGREAYYAFMRTPSAEGGCGAGETTRARPVQVRPNDDKIKQYLDHGKQD
jgi:hypothetical protein